MHYLTVNATISKWFDDSQSHYRITANSYSVEMIAGWLYRLCPIGYVFLMFEQHTYLTAHERIVRFIIPIVRIQTAQFSRSTQRTPFFWQSRALFECHPQQDACEMKAINANMYTEKGDLFLSTSLSIRRFPHSSIDCRRTWCDLV